MRLRLRQVVVVEGRYDAAAVAGLVDGLILTTDGFSLFSSQEKKDLLRCLGRQRGLLILTDSDAAGFRIRHYVEKICAGCQIWHAYIPALPGKERRKSAPAKEGTLGVEGMRPEVLLQALQRAGVLGPGEGAAADSAEGPQGFTAKQPIGYTELFEMGLSGGEGSAERRRKLLKRLGLPARLSKKALCQVLSALYTKKELEAYMREEKPALFWDFHGTLSLPDVVWYDAAMEAAAEALPEKPLSRGVLEENLHGQCLPWWSVPSRDTRHLQAPGAWWAHCEKEFAKMFVNCGFTQPEAALLAPLLREKVLQPGRYTLYPDAIPTLQTLQSRGYRHYLLSNNYPELMEIANALGLSPYLSGVVVSALVGYDKPRVEIFEAARSLAGRPQSCWMIGDNPEDDIAGANRAGFTSVWVHPKPGGKASASHTLQNLAELLPLLP